MVVHVVPSPGGRHQRLGSELLVALAPLAERSGLVPSSETGLFRAVDATLASLSRLPPGTPL